VSQPTSILADVRGFARDHDISNMPQGFVWDLADYIPDRRGAKLEARGPWSYFATTLAGMVWGGKHAAFRAGTKLLVGGGGSMYDVNVSTGAPTLLGAVPVGLHNGVLLRDRVYFADATGAGLPKVVTNTAGTLALGTINASGPKAIVLGAYKERLLAGGVPAPGDPSILYFSPLETTGTAPNVGPLAAWDAKSVIGTTRAITMLFPMAAQILVFHDGSIERIRGSIPPASNVDSDMYVDTFSSQTGCSDPASVVPWQENVCFANPLGVFLTDGSTIRSLTDQGGISDLWRQLYSIKRTGTQVHAAVFRDLLFVTVLTNWNTGTPDEQRPVTLVCDLTDRTWIRFRNVNASAYIDSEIGVEECWWGTDSSVPTLGTNSLSKLSPMLFGPTEYDPELGVPTAPDAVDGNGLPVLGRIRTGWIKLGPEGVKRMRHVYVSHLTQSNPSNKADVYQIGYRLSPFPHLDSVSLGTLPAYPRYKRNRLRIDRRSYGIQVDVAQQLPVYVSRLYDIAIDMWPQDRGKL
jgi:hypothetical protein